MVELQPSKLVVRVRFPSPAPLVRARFSQVIEWMAIPGRYSLIPVISRRFAASRGLAAAWLEPRAKRWKSTASRWAPRPLPEGLAVLAAGHLEAASPRRRGYRPPERQLWAPVGVFGSRTVTPTTKSHAPEIMNVSAATIATAAT